MVKRPSAFLFKNMEKDEIRIKKAKVCKGGTLQVQYEDADGNKITVEGIHKCHSDLLFAMDALIPFFADLTEQKEADRINWDNIGSPENADLLRKIKVSGLSIGGDENNRFITMTGKRTLATSRVLNLNAPGVEMDSETFEWDHIEDFDIVVGNLLYEVKEYIVHNKHEVTQQEFNFDGNPDDPFAEAGETAEVESIETHVESVA